MNKDKIVKASKKWNKTFSEWFKYVADSEDMRKAKDNVILKVLDCK